MTPALLATRPKVIVDEPPHSVGESSLTAAAQCDGVSEYLSGEMQITSV